MNAGSPRSTGDGSANPSASTLWSPWTIGAMASISQCGMMVPAYLTALILISQSIQARKFRILLRSGVQAISGKNASFSHVII